ncbi:HlyD family secretion protein [Sporomusa sp.]|uniref:HlyD family secretion protein n=1 Tax=Sporomusa sp. TaxID=2078658 RepID=UPI002C013030|nr:HlyD family secretion protein [Sporomusa sp.]HWR44545.1 HlyD family secretion protein [Sporomusa sp.]
MSKLKILNNRKTVMIAGAITGLLLVVGGWWWISSSGKISTDDARVKNNIVNVSTKVPGQVEEILVKEGDHVEAGQIIANIDSVSLQIQVEQAQANLASAQAKFASLQAGNRPQQVAQSQASVEQAVANLDNARKNYERAASLYEDGAMSAQQRDSAQTALKVAQAQYDAAAEGLSLVSEGATEQDRQFAEAQMAQAAAALKNAQLQLNNSVIKAPISGTIAKASIDPGEMVSVGQTLFSITNPADAWVEVNIEETDIGKVQIGQSVEFKVDAYPGKNFKGEVTDVGAATGSQFALLPSDNATGNFTKVTQRITVKVKVIDAGNSVLKPGMSAVVDIRTR